MTTHFNHDEHERLLDELAGESDPQALNAHVSACPACQKWPNIPAHQFSKGLPRGGMGVVFKVREQALEREVALKMIKADNDTTADELKRFQREARTMAGLDHANIVTIFALGEHEGSPFFTMEFVTGGTLAARLSKKPAGPREAAEMVRTLALAMAYAHQRGVIHRDLKPANILLTDEGVPKIADFGLSKQIQTTPGAVGTTLTPNNTVLGTPPYMAPEQAQGLKIDEKADVYALGVILYELLTGERPFQEKDYLAVIYKTIHEEPIPLRKLQPDLDDELEAICMKCLQKDAKKRPTAKELADTLQHFLNRKSRWLLATTFLSSAAAVLLAMLLIFGPSRSNSVENPATLAKLQLDLAAAEKRAQALAGEIKQAREITIPNFEKQCQEAKLARQAVEKQFEEATKITIPELTQDLAMAEKRKQEIAGQLKEARKLTPQLENERNDARSAQRDAEGQLKKVKDETTKLEKQRNEALLALDSINTNTIPELKKERDEAERKRQEKQIELTEALTAIALLQKKLADASTKPNPSPPAKIKPNLPYLTFHHPMAGPVEVIFEDSRLVCRPVGEKDWQRIVWLRMSGEKPFSVELSGEKEIYVQLASASLLLDRETGKELKVEPTAPIGKKGKGPKK